MIPPGAEILVSNRFRTPINPFKFSVGNASEDYVRGVFVGEKYPEFTEEILGLEELLRPDFLKMADAAKVVRKFRAEQTAEEIRQDEIDRGKRAEYSRRQTEAKTKADAERAKANKARLERDGYRRIQGWEQPVAPVPVLYSKPLP